MAAQDTILLKDIAEAANANNQILLDIADFAESIRDNMTALANQHFSTGGAVNVGATSKQAASNINQQDANIAAGAVNSILNNASRLGNLKNVGSIGMLISGVGRGLKEFIEVLKVGGPTLRINQGSLGIVVDTINEFASRINGFTDSASKAKTLELFKIVGSSLKGFSENLWNAAIKMKTGKMAITWIVDGLNHFAKKMMEAKYLTSASNGSRYGNTQIEATLGAIGGSLKSFTENLWTTAIKLKTGKIAINWIVDGINMLSERLKSSDKNLDTIGSLRGIGGSIFSFASLTAAAIPFLILAIPGLFLLGGALLAFNLVMKLFNETGMHNILALKKVGISILVFSGSLALSAIVLGAIATGSGILGLGILFGSLAILGLTYKLFGEAFGKMGKGALGVALMSLSLVTFTFALTVSTALIAGIGIMNVLGVLAAVAGFALIFGDAGEFAMEIALGSLAIATIGISLFALGWGLDRLTKTMDNTNIWQLLGDAGLILGLGLVYSGVGLALPFIASGAVAVAAIGGSLWALGAGLHTIMTTDFNPNKVSGFVGSVKQLTGIFDNISMLDAIRIPLKLPAVLAIGAGLFTMAQGIKAWKGLDITEADMKDIANKVAMILTTIPSIFSQIGLKDRGSNQPISLFGKIFGNDFSQGDVERGIESTMKLGTNLKNLADGVMAWKKMVITPSEVDQIQKNVGMVLGVLPSVFADIGKADKEGDKGSIMKSIFGNDFSQGNIEVGIKRATEFAAIFKPLADGIRVWSTGGKEQITPALIDDIKLNVGSLMRVLPETFAKIGSQDKDSEGVWWWSDGDIDRGVGLANKLMPVFTKIGNFITAVKDINIRDKGFEIGLGLTVMFSSLIQFVDKMSEKEAATNTTVDLFDRITRNFGGFANNVLKTNKFLKEFITYTDPVVKIATSFFAITLAIERQVKALNSLSLSNVIAYGQMLGNIAASPARVETNNNYTLGRTGWDNLYPTAQMYNQQQQPRPQAPAPAVTYAVPAPADKRTTHKQDNEMLEAIGNLTQAVANMQGGLTLSPESSRAIGNTIADAIVDYLRRNR